MVYKLNLLVTENVVSVLASGSLEILIPLFMLLQSWAKCKVWFYAYLGITEFFLCEPFSISMLYFHLASMSVILLKTQTCLLK